MDYGKQTQPILVPKGLGVPLNQSSQPSILLLDAIQLLYHIVWPAAGTGIVHSVADVVKERIRQMSREIGKFVIFNIYEDRSAKEHEGWWTGVGCTEFKIELNTNIMGREAIMKNTVDKPNLCQFLCTFDYGPDINMVGRGESLVKHDEVEITLVCYMFDTVKGGASVI